MKVTKLMAVALMATALSTNLFAQSPWTNNTQGNFFSFEFSKGNFEGGNDGINFFTAVYGLSGGVELSDKSELIVDLPIAHYSPKDDDFADKENSVGNLYIGIRTGDRSNPVRGEFGVLLPTTSDDNLFANLVGSYSLPNREEKFASDIWGLSAKVRAEDIIDDNGLFYRVNGGLTYAKYSADDLDFNFLYLDYVGQIGIRSDSGVAGVIGFSGRTALNEDSKYSEDDSFSFVAGIGLSYRSNNFEPGITLNLPLDDPYKQVVDNVINFTFLFHFE